MRTEAVLGVPQSEDGEDTPTPETGRSESDDSEGTPGVADDDLGLTPEDLDEVVKDAQEHQGNLLKGNGNE